MGWSVPDKVCRFIILMNCPVDAFLADLLAVLELRKKVAIMVITVSTEE